MLAPASDDSTTPYAPERQNILCRWFIDGKDYFLAAYRAIKAATTSIFITDWWLVSQDLSLHSVNVDGVVVVRIDWLSLLPRQMGEIYMKRNPLKTKPYHRLDMLLKRKAEEGIYWRPFSTSTFEVLILLLFEIQMLRYSLSYGRKL